ncbi:MULTISPECIES: hypothetical protein [unclassified Saccharicrinis]
MNKLANEEVVFSQAMSNFPLCSPFRGIFFTGTDPYANGLIRNR